MLADHIAQHFREECENESSLNQHRSTQQLIQNSKHFEMISKVTFFYSEWYYIKHL